MNDLEILTAEGGTIIQPLGFSPAPRVSLQSLRASGGTLIYDVAEPLYGVRIEVTDSAAAAGWLQEIYPDAAAAIDAGAPASPSTTGELYGPVTRLMTSLWLHRSWPDEAEGIRDIDLWMLDAEAAELAWSAGALFADGGLADSLVLPHAARIAAARDEATDGVPQDHELIAALAEHVTAAAQKVGVSLGMDEIELSDEPNSELLREVYPTPDDEYDAFRISHLVEGIVRMRLQTAYATGGTWTPNGDASAPFAAEIVAARRRRVA